MLREINDLEEKRGFGKSQPSFFPIQIGLRLDGASAGDVAGGEDGEAAGRRRGGRPGHGTRWRTTAGRAATGGGAPERHCGGSG